MSRLVVVLSLALSGCSLLKPRTDPTRYFVLTAADAPPPAAPITTLLGIDHVTLPEYLVRDEIVSRTATNQIDIADYNRWGEPLRDGFVRTLRRDLEAQLGMDHVVTQPFEPGRSPTLLLDIEVRHLEHVAGAGSVLEVTWVLRNQTGTTLATHDTSTKEPAPDKDVAASVSALSKTIVTLAREIGAAVRTSKAVAASHTAERGARASR